MNARGRFALDARFYIPALVLLAGCFNRREIQRADWGALPQDQPISVRLLDGQTRIFDRFVFTTAGLSGWRQRDTVSLRTDSATVPLDSIAVVRVSEFDKTRTMLLLAAATTAAFIVIAEGQSRERPAAVPRPESSCPFIYAFNGTEYIFDSETYAGAVARAFERADVDNLDHLRAVSGTYRLRFTNEREETHYTDELALLVADHPTGTRALPDASGNPHLIRGGTPPLTQREYGSDTIPSSAGWELSFPRPTAASAALVLRVRNSSVAPFVLQNTLSLLGSEVYAWYGSLRRDVMTRSVVREWMEREGALDVQLRVGDAWRSAARLPDVGPAIAKTNVVVLDLRDVQGDTVRLRLESSPGLWLLDDARLASYAGTVETRVLRPRRAVDERGTDVTAALVARDERYLVTARGSDVRLEFDVPFLAPGLERSVLARTAGHYYVHTDDRRPARRDIVMRLMTDRKFMQEHFAAEWIRQGGAPLQRSVR